MTNQIKQLIQTFVSLSETAFNQMDKLIQFETYDKGTTFIKRHHRNNSEYFVLSGIIKSYLLNPEGDEITLSFFTQNSVLSPHTIRINKGMSTLNFRALTDIKVATIDAAAFEQLMVDNLEIRNFGNVALRQELLLKSEKEIGLAALTAKQRLIQFREKYPSLENEVPHTDIASYLGITNISLSRLRKELMKL